MYVPQPNAVTDPDEVRAMVASIGSASFITTGSDGYPQATLLPVMWHGDRVVAHMALANPHWRDVRPGTPCLLVVDGADAYVSPSWYATKAEHGRVVPTWNYETVHLRGTATIHHDPDWLRDAVTRLTSTHESHRDVPWEVDDAPEAYVTGQLRGIVGLEVVVDDVQAKSKLSQNRSVADRAGVVAGLTATGEPRDAAVARAMRAQSNGLPGPQSND
jgi:transcriptional regulator